MKSCGSFHFLNFQFASLTVLMAGASATGWICKELVLNLTRRSQSFYKMMTSCACGA
jgi:hypothetical protein